MLIKKIQVNNFGKLKNKEIELKNGINIIYGENESGKSTLLDFIVSMFYGINKSKNGKEISNYDKYTPWADGEFSGKICYELDNTENFEVYRNFTKRAPQIFDKNANDISKNFTIDKNEGNKFFYDQTKVDEDLFNMSMVIHQQEVRLDNKSQNTLIQKASNIMLTGEDDISYQEVLRKMNKKQSDEIGTLKSPTKPLYMVMQNVERLKAEKAELMGLNEIKCEIDSEIKSKQLEIDKEEEMLRAMQELQNMKNEAKFEEEKINIYAKTKEASEKSKEELYEELRKVCKARGEEKIYRGIYIIPVVLMIISIAVFLIKDVILGAQGMAISTIIFILIMLRNLSTKRKYRNEELEIREKKREIENKIKLIDDEIFSKDETIQEIRDGLEYKLKAQKERINRECMGAKHILSEEDENDIDIIEEQNYINRLKLDIAQKEIARKQVAEKLERLVDIEERLSENEEILNELNEKNDSINIAKEALEEAYIIMKESITPRFTANLSNSIKTITSGKYRTVKVNEENGIVLETENGNYVTADYLSQGTIDQIYLSLRISSTNELTPENMPIILDETFAYFDEERLTNVLKFLNTSYGDKQIIIFTCTGREIEVLDKIYIDYNKIML